jgi:hypothetical protein
VDEREGDSCLRILRVRAIQFNACGFEVFAELCSAKIRDRVI